MLEFINPKISGFGIDLSDLSIKIINLKKRRNGFTLASFGRQEIKKGIIEEGEIKKEEELVEIIKKAVREVKGGPLKTTYCVASLPETVSFIQMIKMPQMEKQELAEAIKWELESRIPLSHEEIYYDWQIIDHLSKGIPEQQKDHLDILIGVLPKKTVDPYLNVLKKAGLKPFVFEIESVATARALIKKGMTPQPLIIVDFGAKRTNFLIFSERTIFFTTSLPISNMSLIDALSEKLKISKEKATEIKLNAGLNLHHPQSDVFLAMEPPMNELAEKIQSYISFFQEHADTNEKISKILLCGGGASIAGLPEFLNKKINLPVEMGDPLINILKETDTSFTLPPEEKLSYTAALGLALRGKRSKL